MDWSEGWKWKKIHNKGDRDLNVWLGRKNSGNECWGLIYGKNSGKGWRWFKGEIKNQKCKFEIKNKGLGYKENESGKWERLKEGVSISWIK